MVCKKIDFIIEEIIPNKEKKNKVGKKFQMPTSDTYEELKKNNYNIEQLKTICDFHNLRRTGTKPIITSRVYNYLKYSKYAIKIQKTIRRFNQRQFILNCGPAILQKSLCTNQTDFLSMDDIKEIKYPQFYSYKDGDGFIYGFDIISLYNLLLKEGTNAMNPYNRSSFPPNLMTMLKKHIYKSKRKFINNAINIDIPSDIDNISNEKQLELNILEIFQHIDSLGNYSDQTWFSNMTRVNLIVFLRELHDVWNYRAQIDINIKREIVPPHGNPFSHICMHDLYNYSTSHLRKHGLSLIKKLVKSANSRDNQSLGAFYVLGTLTLVNADARNSLPWLYQSFIH